MNNLLRTIAATIFLIPVIIVCLIGFCCALAGWQAGDQFCRRSVDFLNPWKL